MKIITKTITIKRRLNINTEIREFIIRNINYRRHVYNDFVEESRKYENTLDFNAIKFKTYYFNTIEKPQCKYEKYCVGISEQVSKDIARGIKIMRIKKHFYSKLHFKKIDKYHGTFKVHLKPGFQEVSKNNIKFYSRLKIKNNNKIKFRVRNGEWINLNLKESLFDTFENELYYDENQQYYFTLDDVKEITFIHDMGKFYIALSLNVHYVINKRELSYAGIDLGIRNPITLYDGNNVYNDIFKMSHKVLNKIDYLERRSSRLQKILRRKFKLNGGIYSNNYEKVRKKLRITYKKISNIKLDWRRKVTLIIAKKYNLFVIDKFNSPTKLTHRENNIKSNKLMRKFNRSNRRYCMYYTYETLIHNIEKTGGGYIEAPEGTTCTCCKCGHVNNRLPLNKRKLVCEHCGLLIDRDINAATNCYKYIISSI